MKKILFLAAISILISCNKNKDCKVNVICRDKNGALVTGAEVHLYANVKTQYGGNVKADIQSKGVTDSQGGVTFTFELPAIYDVKVYLNSDTAKGIVKLIEGETVVEELQFN